jgi:hypothetical protein
MSYGNDLIEDRKKRRRELRQAALFWPIRDGLFLDLEDLLEVVDIHGGHRATRLNLELVVYALRQLGVPEETLRARFQLQPGFKIIDGLADLLMEPGIAERIEKKVLELHPETPEPGRGPAPVPKEQQTAMIGGVDPLWQSGGAQPH